MQDLTKITTPWGLLDEETKAALKAHNGPIEYWTGRDEWAQAPGPPRHENLTYRAKPPPVRGEVVRYGGVDLVWTKNASNIDTHRLTLPTIDGALIAGEYRDDAGNVIKLEVL